MMQQQQLQTEEETWQVHTPSYSAPIADVQEERMETLDASASTNAEPSLQEVGMADSYLLPLLQAEVRQQKRDGAYMGAISLFFLAAISGITSQAIMDKARNPLYLYEFFGLMVLLSFATFANLARRSYRRKQGLAAELAKPQTVESIGALIDATRVENTHVRNLSKQALTKVLPQLKASNSDLITNAHRERLLRLLSISPNDTGHRDLTELFSRSAYQREVDVRVAILQAYEQIGGPKELAQVERLAKGQASWQSAARVPEKIRQAAKECLPAVQSRVGEQRASEQLLRASSGSAVPADILLRPAQERPQTAPEQLLRPAEETA